jgi:hypothetical protein
MATQRSRTCTRPRNRTGEEAQIGRCAVECTTVTPVQTRKARVARQPTFGTVVGGPPMDSDNRRSYSARRLLLGIALLVAGSVVLDACASDGAASEAKAACSDATYAAPGARPTMGRPPASATPSPPPLPTRPRLPPWTLAGQT